jgi:hypothetical protein
MALQHSPKIVTPRLVLALDAGDINSYPGSGSDWANLANPSLGASLVNSPDFSSSNIGSFRLDGTDDRIFAPSVNTFGGIPEHAFEMWIKSPGLGAGQSIGGLFCPDYGIISYIAPGGELVYYVYNTDNGFPGTNLFDTVVYGANLFDDKWHHIVCTRDNSTFSTYIDGVQKTTGSGGGEWSGSTIWSDMAIQIGNNPNNVGYLFYGSIAMARMYKKYLNPTEVLQNFNTHKNRFGV